MPESRFLKIIVVALLLLNLGTLGFLWMDRRDGGAHRPPPHHGPGGRGENTGEYLRRELQLTDEQEDAYRKMRRQHHETVMDVRDQMRDQKRELYGLMKNGDTVATKGTVNALIDSIVAEQRFIEQFTYDHFRELRALCTPQQQTKFDEVIGDALERMR
jgi:periplasmic protein CpxP/Spy